MMDASRPAGLGKASGSKLASTRPTWDAEIPTSANASASSRCDHCESNFGRCEVAVAT